MGGRTKPLKACVCPGACLDRARMAGESHSMLRTWIVSALLALGTAALFSRSMTYGYINFDDGSFVANNPYVQRGLTWEGVRWAFDTGLGDDFLGYIIARFNFVVAPVLPYLAEARGDHYEETNSIGPDCEAHLQRPMMELARWRPPTSP